MSAAIEEHASVVLRTDMPEHGLTARDIGTVVMVHQGGAGYSVEFMTLTGETVAVVTLPADQVRAIHPDEIAHVRQIIHAS
jgi:hypothetical protein